MNREIRILHLEDCPADAELIRETIDQQGVHYSIQHVSNQAAFEQAVQSRSHDLILSDYGLPGYSGLEALARVRQTDPDLPFILLSGTLGEEQAVESLKLGANDYILKSRVHRLGPAIVRAVREFDEKLNRRHADDALRLNEERLSWVLRSTNDAVWDWDVGDNSIWWNQGLQLLFGYVPVGRQYDAVWWKSCLHPDDHARVVSSLNAAVASNRQNWGEEYRFRCSDGRYAFVFARGYIMRDSEGKAFRMIGSMMDITERKESEEQIRRQAELLDKTHDAIFVTDMEQRIEFWNAGAQRLYGWTTAETLGQRADDLFYRDDSHLQSRQAVLEKGEWTGELKHVTKARQEIVVISRRTLVRDPAGRAAGVLNINTDVTEQKKLEVQFLQAQRLECIGSLAGGIAHDLNNMLAPILMAADMLRGQLQHSEDEKMIELIVASANRGADLIKQILAFSKGTTNTEGVFNVRHLVSDIEKVLRATLPREIRIESRCAANILPVKGDPTQVHQVLMNLCINARDAMPNGGLLRISAGNVDTLQPGEKPAIWIQVRDTGSGIPETLVPKIFDPFFSTKDPGKGTGLGLATVKKIIAIHGGRIEVKSKAGEGTAFTFFLPATHADEKAFDSAALPPPRGRGERVLVVDDEAALREILKATLESYGYDVKVVPNGSEALEALRQHPFELLLTDMNMPGMGGPELVKRAAELARGTAFIVMTGVLEKEAILAIEGKTKVILHKPFSTATLLNALREASDLRDRPAKIMAFPDRAEGVGLAAQEVP